MTADRPSYNCRQKNWEPWRSKNFCLTKPDSVLLSGEELNSCSHGDQFLGNYTAACPKNTELQHFSQAGGRLFFAKLSFGRSKESGNDSFLCEMF
jgi:hypothetical protein